MNWTVPEWEEKRFYPYYYRTSSTPISFLRSDDKCIYLRIVCCLSIIIISKISQSLKLQIKVLTVWNYCTLCVTGKSREGSYNLMHPVTTPSQDHLPKITLLPTLVNISSLLSSKVDPPLDSGLSQVISVLTHRSLCFTFYFSIHYLIYPFPFPKTWDWHLFRSTTPRENVFLVTRK